MKIKLHTETVIDSAHQLKGYNGLCSNVHGHSWFIDIWIQGDSNQLNKDGILFDFGNVKNIKETLDHKFINDYPRFDVDKGGVNPTAENLSMYIYEMLHSFDQLLQYKVRLYETKVGKETWCEVGDF